MHLKAKYAGDCSARKARGVFLFDVKSTAGGTNLDKKYFDDRCVNHFVSGCITRHTKSTCLLITRRFSIEYIAGC